jgi:hypothetical protein
MANKVIGKGAIPEGDRTRYQDIADRLLKWLGEVPGSSERFENVKNCEKKTKFKCPIDC